MLTKFTLQEDIHTIMSPKARTMKKMCYTPEAEHLPSICKVLGSTPAKQTEKERSGRKGMGRREESTI